MSLFIKLYSSALRSESGDSMEEARGRPQKFDDELLSRVMDVIREYRRVTVRGVLDPWEREIFYSKESDLTMSRVCAMCTSFPKCKIKSIQEQSSVLKISNTSSEKILSCTINR